MIKKVSESKGENKRISVQTLSYGKVELFMKFLANADKIVEQFVVKDPCNRRATYKVGFSTISNQWQIIFTFTRSI